MTQHTHSGIPNRRSVRWRGFVLLAAAVAAMSIAACGGSSKPAYCSAVTNLENSIKAVPSTDVAGQGLNALKSSLTKVKSDASAVVAAAKSDFPSETAALSTSVQALTATLKSLPSSLSPATVAQLGQQAAAVVSAAKNLRSATSSKCG